MVEEATLPLPDIHDQQDHSSSSSSLSRAVYRNILKLCCQNGEPNCLSLYRVHYSQKDTIGSGLTTTFRYCSRRSPLWQPHFSRLSSHVGFSFRVEKPLSISVYSTTQQSYSSLYTVKKNTSRSRTVRHKLVSIYSGEMFGFLKNLTLNQFQQTKKRANMWSMRCVYRPKYSHNRSIFPCMFTISAACSGMTQQQASGMTQHGNQVRLQRSTSPLRPLTWSQQRLELYYFGNVNYPVNSIVL